MNENLQQDKVNISLIGSEPVWRIFFDKKEYLKTSYIQQIIDKSMSVREVEGITEIFIRSTDFWIITHRYFKNIIKMKGSWEKKKKNIEFYMKILSEFDNTYSELSIQLYHLLLMVKDIETKDGIVTELQDRLSLKIMSILEEIEQEGEKANDSK